MNHKFYEVCLVSSIQLEKVLHSSLNFYIHWRKGFQACIQLEITNKRFKFWGKINFLKCIDIHNKNKSPYWIRTRDLRVSKLNFNQLHYRYRHPSLAIYSFTKDWNHHVMMHKNISHRVLRTLKLSNWLLLHKGKLLKILLWELTKGRFF